MTVPGANFPSEDSPTVKQIFISESCIWQSTRTVCGKIRKNGIFTRNFLISHTFRQFSDTLLYFSFTFPQFYDTFQIGYTPNDFHAHAHSPKLSTIDGIIIISLSKIELFFFLKLTSLGAKSPFFYIFSSSTPSSNLRWSSYDGRKTIYHFQRHNLSFGSFTSQTLIIQSAISI